MDELDLSKLKYIKTVGVDSASRLPRHKTGEKFLKGPIPEVWLAQAAHLPGKAFVVSIALWFFAGMARKPIIKLSQKLLRSWGVKRKAVYRALIALENAKLISVVRHDGRTPIVTILAVEEHGE